MTAPLDDRQADHLLARGRRLAGSRRDQLFEDALVAARTADAREGVVPATGADRGRVPFWRRWRLAWVMPSLAAAAVALVLVIRPSGPGGDGGFTARGGSPISDGGGAALATLELGCREAPGDGPENAPPPAAAPADGTPLIRCPAGGTLIFRVSGAPRGGQLAAFARPAAGGERIWYLPGPDGAFGQVLASDAPQTLRTGARLPAAQLPGLYVVELVLLDGPVAREQLVSISGARVRGRARVTLEVMP
jgi:hypothetical protein